MIKSTLIRVILMYTKKHKWVWIYGTTPKLRFRGFDDNLDWFKNRRTIRESDIIFWLNEI